MTRGDWMPDPACAECLSGSVCDECYYCKQHCACVPMSLFEVIGISLLMPLATVIVPVALFGHWLKKKCEKK